MLYYISISHFDFSVEIKQLIFVGLLNCFIYRTIVLLPEVFFNENFRKFVSTYAVLLLYVYCFI